MLIVSISGSGKSTLTTQVGCPRLVDGDTLIRAKFGGYLDGWRTNPAIRKVNDLRNAAYLAEYDAANPSDIILFNWAWPNLFGRYAALWRPVSVKVAYDRQIMRAKLDGKIPVYTDIDQAMRVWDMQSRLVELSINTDRLKELVGAK